MKLWLDAFLIATVFMCFVLAGCAISQSYHHDKNTKGERLP